MNVVDLARGVYFVGAVDWNVRDFHGYTTPRGVTYNSYLIVDEKVCLIDTVKAPFAGELLERISTIIDPAKIDYVVVNHIEPDHASALPEVMKRAPKAKVMITAQGKESIPKYYGEEYDFQVVKEGDVLQLGSKTLKFLPLPMLHWPDSMATYLAEDQILFSNDAFGQHLCSAERFDDQMDLSTVLYEAEKYYANILMPYTRLIPKALSKAGEFPIRLIAPSHGVVWRSHINDILKKYEQWGTGKTVKKVLVAYDSMWGSTDQMARQILEGLAASGVSGRLYRMSGAERSEVARDMLEAAGILVGSSTLNNGMLPTVAALLYYLKGLRPAGKKAAAFGAYGWGGGAQKDMEELIKSSAMVLEPGLTVKWTASAEEFRQCFEFGREFGRKIMEQE